MVFIITTMAATAALQSPMWIGPEQWITRDDYPIELARQSIDGVAVYRLVVSSAGLPESCTITISSGNQLLDDKTCAIALERGRFKPAEDERGEKVYGTFKSRIAWAVPGKPAPSISEAYVELRVLTQKLPDKLGKRPLVNVAVQVEETGKMTRCEPRTGPELAILGSVACKQALLQWVPYALTDGNKRPVRSVQTLLVSFEVEAGQDK